MIMTNGPRTRRQKTFCGILAEKRPDDRQPEEAEGEHFAGAEFQRNFRQSDARNDKNNRARKPAKHA